MNDSKDIDEIGLKKEWFDKADRVKSLDDFIALYGDLNNFNHGYGTVCHAMAALGHAAMRAFDAGPYGGITGFQASCVAWDLIPKYFMVSEGEPLRLVNYADLLYPQYENKFNCISIETWQYIQAKAAEFLKQNNKLVAVPVLKHWQSIVDGIIPFGLSVEEK